MNIKTTILLFGALVGMLLVFGVMQLTGVRPPGALDAFVLPDFHNKKSGAATKDIDTVEITRTRPKPETLVFVKGDDGWQMVKPHRLRVDKFLVDRVVSQVADAKREKADLSTNLGEYGLDEPGTVVTLKRGVDREWKLNVGKETGGSSTAVAYVTSSQRKEPMAVKRNELDALFKGANDFRSKELLASGAFNTEAVTVKVGDGDPLSLAKGKDGKWAFEKPAYGDADYEGEPTAPTGDEKKISGVRDLLDAVGGIRAESEADFVEAAASEEDLKKYGLEKGNPARLRVEVKYAPGGMLGKDEKRGPVTETLLIGKRVEDKDAKADRYYARLESENAVVRVPAKSVEPLVRVAGSPETLRNRDLVQLDTAKADAVDVKNAAGTLKLRKTGGPFDDWKVFAGGAGRKADRMAVQDLLNDLTRKRQVKNFPSEKREGDLGFDRPTAEVSLWVDGLKKDDKKDEKKEEKKDDKKEEKKEEKKADDEPALKSDKPAVRLVFGKKEDNLLYVKRIVGDEKPVLLAVEATPLLDKLGDGALAYLDRNLPSLPPEDTVTKITLLRDGETYELVRKEDKSWSVQQPATFQGRTADSGKIAQLLATLRNLMADKFVAEKPSDADLEAKFGLKSPPYKVTLTTTNKEKTEDHVFLFGKETGDKDLRYAKRGDGDLVFQVGAFALGPIKGELLDTTVFKFDPAKVRVVKLTGWHNVDPDIPPLEVERKDGQWTAKNRTNFPLDGAKVDSLLAALANLRAQKFLPGAAKPEHKLSLKEGALEIAITFEGDAAPSYLLTVGPHHAADKGHYATTNKLATTALLLPEEPFKGPLSGTSHFRK